MSYKYKRGQQYESRNRETIEDLSREYANRNFEYDPTTDKAYQDYAAMMRESGARAMTDTMGKATAGTGGYANSYASVAGQQVYNDYAREIGAAQEDFYDRALARFETEGNALLNKLSLAEQQEARDKSYWEEDYAADLARAEREGTAALADFYGFKDEQSYLDHLSDQLDATLAYPTQETLDKAVADFMSTKHFSGNMTDEDKIGKIVDKYIGMGYKGSVIAQALEDARDAFAATNNRTWTWVSGNGKDAIFEDEFGNRHTRDYIVNSARDLNISNENAEALNIDEFEKALKRNRRKSKWSKSED